METLSSNKQTKATKEHRCNFCSEKISVGEIYVKSTHKSDGDIYDWKAHVHCDNIATRLKMYDEAMDSGYEGVNDEFFVETIHCKHDDLLMTLIPSEERQKYSDIIEQLKKVRFKDKLMYVIRYYAKLDKNNSQTNK